MRILAGWSFKLLLDEHQLGHACLLFWPYAPRFAHLAAALTNADKLPLE
jgi:hypothetical protein